MSSNPDPILQANQLPISIEFPRDDENFYDVLSLWQRRVSTAVNTKTGGLYDIQERFSFKQYFTTGQPFVYRNCFRKCFDMVNLNGGNIAGGATVSFPHGISNLFQSCDVVADCTSTIPTYFSVMGPTSVWLDAVNVNFTNPIGSPLSAVTVTAEYLKN